MNLINILGVNITILNRKAILNTIKQFFEDGRQHYVVTPNPEIILAAHKDEEFFYILNKADMAIPDGFGLKIAALLTGKNITRITGADLVKDILDLAQKKKLKVAVFNWRKGLSKAADIQKVLKKHYPDLQFIIEEVDRKWRMPHYQNINIFQPDIAFVAIGAPWQEKFIYHALTPNPSPTPSSRERGVTVNKMPCVKLAIGVGGAFDFLTGKTKRSPKFLRILGLEWLWRLIRQPWRWKRIYNAVIIFPWEFFKWRFVHPFLYRPNVACMLYKKEFRHRTTNAVHANKEKGYNFKILLVERKNESGHWQIPQGGTDGENLKTAGIRELIEEIGASKFKPVKAIKDVYKYKFGNEISRAGILSRNIRGYKGHKQGLFVAEFIGNDNDIKINFWDHSGWKWVDSENLVNKVHPLRKEGIKIFLEKFNQVTKSYKSY